VGAADEVALRTARPQGIRQRQAAHDMAAAHVQGCVGAEGDFQWFHSTRITLDVLAIPSRFS